MKVSLVISVIINKEAGSLPLLRSFEFTLLLQGGKHTVIDTGRFFENRIGFTLRFCPVFGIRDPQLCRIKCRIKPQVFLFLIIPEALEGDSCLLYTSPSPRD